MSAGGDLLPVDPQGRAQLEETDRCWRLHLEPSWGETLLAGFDRPDIQDWADEDLAGWKAPGTVELIYEDLQLLLSGAADNRPAILTYNPRYNIRLPEGNDAEAIHTDASDTAGIPDSAAKARLGHSRRGRGISGVYSHVLPETEDRIIKVLRARYEAAILR
ncbi:hypothetical protein CcI49_02705 [Frankia sp. CcI49]|uniref:hypothetical protein n=1 Tax=unclassified Frankia TaxID=2632575 RepID=UPI0006CA1D73|nr:MULTISPECIES: hypothetical protein [unclassified Frankia]KPM55626.1 hypothetical protein ACG83_10055 [Frankia sp. R43]ONH62305.1 hypothetical protein CcI49_02705 [Frankia sp. CcI49]